MTDSVLPAWSINLKCSAWNSACQSLAMERRRSLYVQMSRQFIMLICRSCIFGGERNDTCLGNRQKSSSYDVVGVNDGHPSLTSWMRLSWCWACILGCNAVWNNVIIIVIVEIIVRTSHQIRHVRIIIIMVITIVAILEDTIRHIVIVARIGSVVGSMRRIVINLSWFAKKNLRCC